MSVQQTSKPLSSIAAIRRNKRGAAQLSEFACALLLFVTVFLLPSLFVVRFAIGIGLGQIATDRAAQVAASSAAYDLAQSKAQRLFDATMASTLGAVASLGPTAGALGTGVDLYISAEDRKKKKEIYGPNKVMIRDIDLVKKRYFYTVVTHIKMDVLPGCDPHTALVGFLAKPMILNFQASRRVENPECLKTIAGAAQSLSKKNVDAGIHHES